MSIGRRYINSRSAYLFFILGKGYQKRAGAVDNRGEMTGGIWGKMQHNKMDAGKCSGKSLTICCRTETAPADPPITIMSAGCNSLTGKQYRVLGETRPGNC
jgi:hypothetical protein